MNIFPLTVQTYSTHTKEWTNTVFETKEDFTSFVWKCFRKPGLYHLGPETRVWREAALKFEADGVYTDTIEGTAQYDRYWDREKAKVLNGIIVDGKYIPGFFYFYLNYCPIFNRKKKTETLPNIFDSDYHFFLYILLCLLLGKHAVVVKTRQRGYSYKIMAIMLWSYWWFKGSINTIGASDEEFTQKSWEYINTYRNHLNSHTAWIRGPFIPKNLDWLERVMTDDGKYVGNNSKFKGLTFKQSPTKGVGGAQSFFFYEEAGIAPTLLQTVGYIRPAVEMGNITTGLIIISGSVGELDHCQDLKSIFENPSAHNFLGLKNDFELDSIHEEIGFFVPDTWSLEGFMDEWGNSNIEGAEAFIQEKRKAAEQNKRAEDYQLEVSQSPLTPSEAFASRKRSFFPSALINRQQDRINVNKPPIRPVILYETAEKTIKWRTADRDGDPKPIKTYPVPEAIKDVRGCVEIEEFPDENPGFYTYFAGVDPISTDKTTTSESLFSVTIFKNLTETKYNDDDGKAQVRMTGFKAVAWYTGRMEDLKQTNEIGEYLLRMYNAFAIVESNVQTFINHMQNRLMQRHLATKKEIGFLEDLHANQNVHKTYGVHMTPVIKSYILQNIKDYMIEETDIIRKSDGEPIRTVYGIERINDIALLQEAKMYRDGLNADRLISFGLALSLAKHHVLNGMYNRIDKTEKQEKVIVTAPRKSFFRNEDYASTNLKIPPRKKSYFKNLG